MYGKNHHTLALTPLLTRIMKHNRRLRRRYKSLGRQRERLSRPVLRRLEDDGFRSDHPMLLHLQHLNTLSEGLFGLSGIRLWPGRRSPHNRTGRVTDHHGASDLP